MKHYHQVGSLNDALRAVDGGVDGLIVEGAESGGLRGVRSPHLFTLLQQVRRPCRRADRRRRRDRRRARDGRRVRARRRGHPHGHPLHERRREPGARQLEARRSPTPTSPSTSTRASPGVRMRVVGNELAEAVFRGDDRPGRQPVRRTGPRGDRERPRRHGDGRAPANRRRSSTRSSPSSEIIDDTVATFWREMERLAEDALRRRVPHRLTGDAGPRRLTRTGRRRAARCWNGRACRAPPWDRGTRSAA